MARTAANTSINELMGGGMIPVDTLPQVSRSKIMKAVRAERLDMTKNMINMTNAIDKNSKVILDKNKMSAHQQGRMHASVLEKVLPKLLEKQHRIKDAVAPRKDTLVNFFKQREQKSLQQKAYDRTYQGKYNKQLLDSVVQLHNFDTHQTKHFYKELLEYQRYQSRFLRIMSGRNGLIDRVFEGVLDMSRGAVTGLVGGAMTGLGKIFTTALVQGPIRLAVKATKSFFSIFSVIPALLAGSRPGEKVNPLSVIGGVKSLFHVLKLVLLAGEAYKLFTNPHSDEDVAKALKITGRKVDLIDKIAFFTGKVLNDFSFGLADYFSEKLTGKKIDELLDIAGHALEDRFKSMMKFVSDELDKFKSDPKQYVKDIPDRIMGVVKEGFDALTDSQTFKDINSYVVKQVADFRADPAKYAKDLVNSTIDLAKSAITMLTSTEMYKSIEGWMSKQFDNFWQGPAIYNASTQSIIGYEDGTFDKIVKFVKGGIMAVLTAIMKPVTNMLPDKEAVTKGIIDVGDWLADHGVMLVNAVYDWAASVINSLFTKSSNKDPTTPAEALVSSAGKIVVSVGGAILTRVKETLTSKEFWQGVGNAGLFVAHLGNQAVNAALELGGELLKQAALGTLQAIKDTLGSTMAIDLLRGTSFGTTFKDITTSITGIVKAVMGIFDTMAMGVLKIGILIEKTGISKLIPVFEDSVAVVAVQVANLPNIFAKLSNYFGVMQRSLTTFGGEVEKIGHGGNFEDIVKTADETRGILSPVIRLFNTLRQGFGFLDTIVNVTADIIKPLMVAVKGIGKLVGKIAWPLQILFSVYDFVSGFADASEKLDIKPEDLKLGDKIKSGIGSVIGGLLDMPVHAVVWLANYISESFGWGSVGSIDNIGQLFGFDNTNKLVKSMLDNTVGDISQVFGGVKDILSGIGHAYISVFKWAARKAASWIGWDIFSNDPDASLESAATSVTGAVDGIGSGVGGILKLFTRVPYSIISWVFNRMAEALGFDMRVPKSIDDILAKISVPSLSEMLTNTVTSIYNWMADLFSTKNLKALLAKNMPDFAAEALGLKDPATKQLVGPPPVVATPAGPGVTTWDSSSAVVNPSTTVQPVPAMKSMVPAVVPPAQFGPGDFMPFADGGIINSPISFMLNKNKAGVAGEDGKEAIMPLTNTKSGALGVMAKIELDSTTFNKFVTAIDGLADTMNAFAGKAIDQGNSVYQNNIAPMINNVQQQATPVMNSMLKSVGPVANSVVSSANSFAQQAMPMINAGVGAVTNTASNMYNSAKPIVSNAANSAVSASQDLIKTFTGKAKAAYDYFVSLGWSAAQAAGLVANIRHESDFNDKLPGDKNSQGVYEAYGLAQWHANRRAQFKAVFGKDMQDSSFKDQLDFINWELNNTEKSAGAALRNATNPSAAGAIVSRLFERPGDADGQASARANTAVSFSQQFGIPSSDAISNAAATVSSVASGVASGAMNLTTQAVNSPAGQAVGTAAGDAASYLSKKFGQAQAMGKQLMGGKDFDIDGIMKQINGDSAASPLAQQRANEFKQQQTDTLASLNADLKKHGFAPVGMDNFGFTSPKADPDMVGPRDNTSPIPNPPIQAPPKARVIPNIAPTITASNQLPVYSPMANIPFILADTGLAIIGVEGLA